MRAERDRDRWTDLPRTVAAVFSRPSRLRRFAALGPAAWWRTLRFLSGVVPRASRALDAVRARAATIPDPVLRAQALASIDEKAYHVQGGCILATFLSGAAEQRFIDIVTPLETIYDYLDNLCDRLPEVPTAAYPTLHEALLDALDLSRTPSDYYRDGPLRDDGGYLNWLVDRARAGIARLPNYDGVSERTLEAANFYAELQHLKHLPAVEREDSCEAWYLRNEARFPGLFWWEFAAACGSSLPVFAMLFLASHRTLRAGDVRDTYDAYFPSVAAVHILLDYFIDQAEDKANAELNFIACYASIEEAVERVRALVGDTARRLKSLAHAERHGFAMQAMCTFYLTHPKVFAQRLDRESCVLLDSLGS